MMVKVAPNTFVNPDLVSVVESVRDWEGAFYVTNVVIQFVKGPSLTLASEFKLEDVIAALNQVEKRTDER